MNKLEEIREFYNEFEDFEPEETPLTADGCDDAVIGIDVQSYRMVYSQEKCISILMERDGMPYDEAVEWFEYNTLRASLYVEEMAPIYVYTGGEL